MPVIAVQTGRPVLGLDAGLNQETSTNWLGPTHRHRAFDMHVGRVALSGNRPGAEATARMCSASHKCLDDNFPVMSHGAFFPYLICIAHASAFATLALPWVFAKASLEPTVPTQLRISRCGGAIRQSSGNSRCASDVMDERMTTSGTADR